MCSWLTVALLALFVLQFAVCLFQEVQSEVDYVEVEINEESCGELSLSPQAFVALIKWNYDEQRDKGCHKNSIDVKYSSWHIFNVNTTSCLRWYQTEAIACTRGLMGGSDWLEYAIRKSLHVDPKLLLCAAYVCLGKDLAPFLTTSTTTSTTLSPTTLNDSTAAVTFYYESDAMLDWLEQSFNETIERLRQENEERKVLMWMLVTSSVLFAFFAIVAAYDSFAIILRRKQP